MYIYIQRWGIVRCHFMFDYQRASDSNIVFSIAGKSLITIHFGIYLEASINQCAIFGIVGRIFTHWIPHVKDDLRPWNPWLFALDRHVRSLSSYPEIFGLCLHVGTHMNLAKIAIVWASWRRSSGFEIICPIFSHTRQELDHSSDPKGTESLQHKTRWAVFKIPLSFNYTGCLIGIPLLDYCNPQYSSIIPYNHQPTGVLNTAEGFLWSQRSPVTPFEHRGLRHVKLGLVHRLLTRPFVLKSASQSMTGWWLSQPSEKWESVGRYKIPSGKHTKSYWTWPFIVDLPRVYQRLFQSKQPDDAMK